MKAAQGPDNDVVAFSTMCPHKGFPLSYNAESRTLNCPGHYSVFDCEAGGQECGARQPRTCRGLHCPFTSNGDVFAEGVDELLYGRLSNVL